MVLLARARLACALVLLATGLLEPPAATAADWPQFRGPNRDGVSPESGLLRSWPQGGPKVLWSTPVGQGYAAAAIVAGRVYFNDYDRPLGHRASVRGFESLEGVVGLDVGTVSRPSPRAIVLSPTSTPATSVRALSGPGCPSNGTPRSRAPGLLLGRDGRDCGKQQHVHTPGFSHGASSEDAADSTGGSMGGGAADREAEFGEGPGRTTHGSDRRPPD